MRRFLIRLFRVVAILSVLAVAVVYVSFRQSSRNTQSHYIARNAALRAMPLFFYPSTDTTHPPRGVVFFLGNDVGFWQPHHQLAAIMAADGYHAIGYDMKPLLSALPEEEPARDSVFGVRIAEIISDARAELHAENLPLIIGGHSIGAEVALWISAHVKLPGAIGVLAVSPGSRSHLRISASDISNTAEPTDAESFALTDVVRAMPAELRLAIVRGENDRYAFADSALLYCGGSRAKRFSVPLAGHSLKSLFVAQFVIRNALAWLEEPARVVINRNAARR